MGYRQCLPLSVVQLKGKHCRKPHCRNGVVDTFGQGWTACIGTLWPLQYLENYLGLLETLWSDLQYNALVHHQNSCRVCCLYICCADQHYKSQATAVKNSFCLLCTCKSLCTISLSMSNLGTNIFCFWFLWLKYIDILMQIS